MGDRVPWAFRRDPPGESDEQLTDRARTGDKSAFGELYRRHRKAAESTAWCLLRSKSDADDVVSDAFAGVLSALRNGRGPRDNFRGYLLACVRNGCRTRRTPTVLVDENQLERWNPALEDPEKFVEADTVARAFSSLAPRWQHTLWMTEVEQLPPTEVSERLNLSPNATAALTHRARQAFTEAYLAEHVGTVTTKDCKRIAALLPGYVRDQLRDLQQASVERHLVNCQHCAAAVENLRDVNASLRSLMPQTILGAAVATQATAVVTATTVGGGLTLGLPSASLLLKGLAAILVVAPILSTDSPFSSGRGGNAEARLVSVREAVVGDDATATGETPDDVVAQRPSTSDVASPPTSQTEPDATVPTATEAPEQPRSTAAERPTATAPITAVTLPPVTLPPVTLPPVTLPPVTLPVIPVPLPTSIVPPGLIDAVDDVVNDTVRPLVGAVTEPVVETLDEALAMMGLGSTGETVALLRALVPLLDGPLLGPVVDDLLDVASIDVAPAGAPAPADADPESPAGSSADPGADIAAPAPASPTDPSSEDLPTVPVPGQLPSLPGSDAAPSITTPSDVPVTIPPVTLPVISTPAIVVPVISVPPISVPPISVPLLGLPVIDLPAISLPPISLPPITLPNLLG